MLSGEGPAKAPRPRAAAQGTANAPRPRLEGPTSVFEPTTRDEAWPAGAIPSERILEGALAPSRVTVESAGHPPARFRVLGIPVDAVQIPGAVERMLGWIEAGDRGRFVAVTGMHGVTEALDDPVTREALRAADLVVPDGMPLVWLGRMSGHQLRRRVYGPELMLEFFEAAAPRGCRHFLYGGAPGVADALAARLADRFPGTVIAGTLSPPFRPLSAEEREEIWKTISAARPDVVWVGLSTPKQEKWMRESRPSLDVPLLVGVGAAFDLNSGRLRQAPEWMRENGLEWLFRLAQEPRRLWKRYLVQGPRFVYNVALERMSLRRFD